MQLLSSCYLFRGLSKSQLHRLSALAKEVQIQKGQWLMHERQEGTEMFVLKEGAVELLTTVNDDFELPIAILRNPGDCTGTASLLEPYLYSLSVRCAEEGKMLVIKRVDLQKLITDDCELGFTVMTNLAKHLLDRLKETRLELKIHFKTLFKSAHH
jgi:CRP/FNR family cyclic AMP-dependent transcriptional regulator